ncbi:MAG: sigma-70 family RNA polymerase sigma factor [Thiobacillaceae bacterium]
MSVRIRRFEAAALPHLTAAYNLARWLLRDDQSAQDVVQDAYLRGLRYFDSFRGGDARPWLLGIVRNCCYTWLKQRGSTEQVEFDEAWDSRADEAHLNATPDNPEQLLMRKQNMERIDRAIEALPLVFREVIVLREIEDLSYEQIAEAVAIPVGTVMSRLARARAMLRPLLARDN